MTGLRTSQKKRDSLREKSLLMEQPSSELRELEEEEEYPSR